MLTLIARISPTHYLRVEGATLFVLALLGFWHFTNGASWLIFAAAFLLPDVAMLGYLISRSVGALAYNLAHTEVLPATVLAVGLIMAQTVLLSVAFIWLAHIGFDRMLGYGLKHVDAFAHTHLGRIGRSVGDS